MIVNFVLWIAGAALIVAGLAMIQRPLSRYNELRQIDENARRYEAWRGGSRRTAASGGPTGADLMKDQMRQRVYLWAGVIVVGVVLVFAGFAIR
jgi:hypothetical protein